MNITTFLLADSFFLAVILLVLIVVMIRNGNSKHKEKKIKTDIKRIKEQILG